MKTCPNPRCPDVVRSGVVGEYIDSVEVCASCGAQLVQETLDSLSPTAVLSEEPDVAANAETAVSVLQTADDGLIALVKSLFEAEGIDYFLKGEGLQDLLGWGRIVGGFNYVVGPAEFLVRKIDADRALTLLADVQGANKDASQSEEDV